MTPTAQIPDAAIREAIDRFDKAAQDWGWTSDQGYNGDTIISSQKEYNDAKERLIALTAAQADFERRVLSYGTLTNEGTKPVDVAAVQGMHVISDEVIGLVADALRPFSEHAQEYKAEDKDHSSVWPTFEIGDFRCANRAFEALFPEPAHCNTCNGKGFVGGVIALGQGEVDANCEDCPDCTVTEPAQGEQWLNMKDAPRDGTKIDVWMMPHGYRETDVFWSGLQEAWCRESEYPEEPTPLSIVPYPAFWMPLPAAPTPEAGR